MKKFVAELLGSNGGLIKRLLVKNPRFENGVFKATIVGTPIEYSLDFETCEELEMSFSGGVVYYYEYKKEEDDNK